MILELQNRILEMIAKGESLVSTVERLCLEVEGAVPGVTCSVMLLDGDRLHPLAGPSLDPGYLAALDDMEIGPLAGSCGTAAYLGSEVVVTNIASDPPMADVQGLDRAPGLQGLLVKTNSQRRAGSRHVRLLLSRAARAKRTRAEDCRRVHTFVRDRDGTERAGDGAPAPDLHRCFDGLVQPGEVQQGPGGAACSRAVPMGRAADRHR